MSEKTLEITESDEAGNVTATYVQSPSNQDERSRIDVIVRSPTQPLLEQDLRPVHSYLKMPNRCGRDSWTSSCQLGTHIP